MKDFANFRSLTLSLLFLGTATSFADEGVALKTDGLEIILPKGWELLEQPTNLLIQVRAREPERGIAFSGGSFRFELAVQEYVTIGIAVLQETPDDHFEKISKLIGVSVPEIEKILKSRLGQQFAEQMKQSLKTMRIELLGVAKTKVAEETAYETQMKMTVLSSGQVLFGRQFVLAGSVPKEIVQLSFASASKDIFTDKTLLDAIKKEQK